jgi:GGDEF domain-containing protein
MSEFTLRRLALTGPRWALIPLFLVPNCVLGLAAVALPWLAAALLVLAVSALEGFLWLGTRQTRSEPAANEPRLAALFHRSALARQSSIRDDTTGLLNRWYLESRIEQEAARCRRYDLSTAVIVVRTGLIRLSEMSLDGWQSRSADAAQRTLQSVRITDLTASLAPFEFAICLVHCDREGAERAAERLQAELEDLTCDVGIAIYPEDNCEPRAMIELARVRSHSSARAA